MNYLRAWRKSLGLTQEKLAERIETNKAQISNWENRHRDITGKAQAALEHALGIAPGDLYRDPARPSADELMSKLSERERTEVIDYIRFKLESRERKAS